MKKFISIILAIFILTLSISTIALADEISLSPAQKSAAALQSLNLFAGTDKGFELEREPLRIECVVTIIRLLGEEKTALESTATHPFTDIPAWADRYAAYAYENGITKGVSSTEFGYDVKADSKQFSTLLLRTLGYSENAGDFTFNEAVEAGKTYKIIDETVNSDKFLRGDMVIMSYLALSVPVKGTENTLSDTLITKGVFTKDAYDKAIIITNGTPENKPSTPSTGGSSSGGSTSGGSSLGKPDANAEEQRAELPALIETVKDYYSELSKVIVLVDKEDLHTEFDEITTRVEAASSINPSGLSDSEVSKNYNELKDLFDDMEILAITIAVER